MNSCIVCKSRAFKDYCVDWQGNAFEYCPICKLVVRKNGIKVDYQNVNWHQITDPDGKQRNILRERDNKINNWYGELIHYLNSKAVRRLLDVGCGPGFLLSALNASIEKQGVELNKECVDFINANSPEIKVANDLLENVKYPDKYFDVVVLYHVIEHIEDPKNMLNEARRILSDDGIIIIGTPNMDSFCAKKYKGNFRLLGREHAVLYNKKNLTALLDKHGFCLFKTEYPFFRTCYFTLANLFRLFSQNKISPPFWGNIMTLYARKKENY